MVGSPSSYADSSYPATPAEANEPLPVFETSGTHSARLQAALYQWARENRAHQDEHLCFEDEMGAEPAHQALHILHGPLSSFVDYPAMVALGTQDYCFPDTIPFDSIEFLTAPDEEFGPAAFATSLDHSLPTSAIRSTVEEGESPANGTTTFISDAAWDGVKMEILHQGPVSNKRKNPDGEEGGLFQNGRRKKLRKFPGDRLRQTTIKREALKAAGFTDATAVCMMAGVCLGSVETARRIEDMVGHRYGVNEVRELQHFDFPVMSYIDTLKTTQRSFPVRLVAHPFLFDLEVAKMQTLWHILQ
jgi:hypothetical protein